MDLKAIMFTYVQHVLAESLKKYKGEEDNTQISVYDKTLSCFEDYFESLFDQLISQKFCISPDQQQQQDELTAIQVQINFGDMMRSRQLIFGQRLQMVKQQQVKLFGPPKLSFQTLKQQNLKQSKQQNQIVSQEQNVGQIVNTFLNVSLVPNYVVVESQSRDPLVEISSTIAQDFELGVHQLSGDQTNNVGERISLNDQLIKTPLMPVCYTDLVYHSYGDLAAEIIDNARYDFESHQPVQSVVQSDRIK